MLGVLWIFESVHYFYHGDHSTIEDCQDLQELFFRIIGCINLARGFLIFLIFVCKESTLKKLSRISLCGVRPRLEPGRGRGRTETSLTESFVSGQILLRDNITNTDVQSAGPLSDSSQEHPR